MSFGFNVGQPDYRESYPKHPGLMAGDVLMLQDLFPSLSFWNEPRYKASVHILTKEQATELYDAMTKYAAEHEVSDEPYIAGGTTGPVLATSNLKSVFDDVLPFLRKELGIEETVQMH